MATQQLTSDVIRKERERRLRRYRYLFLVYWNMVEWAYTPQAEINRVRASLAEAQRMVWDG